MCIEAMRVAFLLHVHASSLEGPSFHPPSHPGWMFIARQRRSPTAWMPKLPLLPFLLRLSWHGRVSAFVRRLTAKRPLFAHEPRLRVLRALRHELPYFLVMTAPVASWMPAARFHHSPDQLRPRCLNDLTLLNFVARLAREQMKGGRHFVFSPSFAFGRLAIPSSSAVAAKT